MRIAFLSADMCDGGAQRVIATVSGELAEKGHEVYLLIFSASSRDYKISEKVKTEIMKNRYEDYQKMSSISRLSYIRKYLTKIKPDIGVGFLQAGYALYMASAGLRICKVASVRVDPGVIDRYKGVRASLNRHWFKQADAVVLQTEGQREYAVKHHWKNITVIPNPVDELAVQSSEHMYDRECKRIVMAGRLVGQKNYELALRAFQKAAKRFRNIELSVFGEGTDKERIQKRIRELNLEKNVHLRGFSMDLLNEFAESDLFLLTSDYEGMPNSLMEAMAMGLPCIATDCPTGPGDLIEHKKNGFLVPMGDEETLAKQICEVLAMNPKERGIVGMLAKQTIKSNYSASQIADQWEKLFERVRR